MNAEDFDRLRAEATRLGLKVPTQEEAAHTSGLVAQKLIDRPEFRRFAARVLATDDNRVYSADDVIGERQMLIASLLRGDYEVRNGDPRWSIEAERLSIGMRGLLGDPYLWKASIFSEVVDMELPPHVVSRTLLPQPRMWWTLETAFGSFRRDGSKAGIVDALILSDEGQGFSLFAFSSNDDPGQEFIEDRIGSDHWIDCGSVTYGSRYPDDFDDGAVGVRPVLALLAFLNSPYVPKTQGRVSRSLRRLGQRVDDTIVPDVTFVDLRRVSQHKDSEEGDGQRDWKHRWIVQGHLRAQWYPSEQAHHVIYIAPYMKGPEDAPLLTHAYRVKR